jgi:glycosyltransferase 2 family protein
LRRTTGVSAFEIGATVLVERILDVFVIALLGAALWALFPDRAWIQVMTLICFGVIVGFAIFVAALALLRERLPSLLARLLSKLPLVSNKRAVHVSTALRAGGSVLLRPRQLIEVVLLSIVLWGLGGLSIWILFPAFDLHAGAVSPWLILVANTFAIAVPSGPGTVGVYEASVQVALIAFGVAASTALSFAIVLHAIHFFPVILIGMIASWWIGRHPADRRFDQPSARISGLSGAPGRDADEAAPGRTAH